MVDIVELLAHAHQQPEPLRSGLLEVLGEYERTRSKLIQEIQSHRCNPFTDDELKTLTTEELKLNASMIRAIKSLARQPHPFSGN